MKRSMPFGLLMLVGALLGPARAADTYMIDAAHTTIGFSVAHLVISDVKGRFGEFEGTLTVDPQAKNALTEIRGTIQVKSVDTGIAARDEHLRGEDFFDAAKFPTITFESKRISRRGSRQVVAGTLTMHGVSKEIAAPVTVKGPIKDPWGKTRLGMKTTLVLNRKDFGLTWNKVLESGGVVVGEEIEIEINAEAVKQEPVAK